MSIGYSVVFNNMNMKKGIEEIFQTNKHSPQS